MNKKSLWAFGTREVVFSAIGAALYAVLSYGTNLLQIPGSANVSIRPAVAIPMFFGVAFGPIVGFITGILGNILNDFLSGNGFWPWWDLGNGLMGLIPGLVFPMMDTFRSGADIFKAEITVLVGSFVGMFLASITEIWVSGVTFANTIVINFVPSFLTNIINGLIVVPILMLAYSAVKVRSGR